MYFESAALESISGTWTRLGTTVVSSFLASLVECVEALTVVLAVGSVRGWRSALAGVGAALVVLTAVVAVLGPALTRIPLRLVQLTVGTMVLLFGLRWLRKAILRSAGLIPLHNERAAFAQNAAAMREVKADGNNDHGRFDKIAFVASFNITMLEGTEVVFIVIALGAGGGGLLLSAGMGAVGALAVISVLGFILHRPLARVPQNTLKFFVGVLLSALGTFWVGEGAGFAWPGFASSDLAIPGLMVAYLVLGLGLVSMCRAGVAEVEE